MLDCPQQEHLEAHDQERVEGEQAADHRLREVVGRSQIERQRAPDLEERRCEQKDQHEEGEEREIGERRAVDTSVALRGVLAMDRRARQAEGEGEQDASRPAGRRVTDEQPPVVVDREQAADRRTDRHAGVDREPDEGEGADPRRHRTVVRDRDHHCRAKRIGNRCREQHGDRDLPRAAGLAEHEEGDAGGCQRQELDPDRAEPIRQPAAEQGAEHRSDAVQGQHATRLDRRHVQPAGEVEAQERQHHGPGAIDEGTEREQPHLSREPGEGGAIGRGETPHEQHESSLRGRDGPVYEGTSGWFAAVRTAPAAAMTTRLTAMAALWESEHWRSSCSKPSDPRS